MARYHFKFLFKAITTLVTDPGDVRQRLAHAADDFLEIPAAVFPQHLRAQAEAITAYLTEFKAEPGMPWPFNSDVYVTMKRRQNRTAVPVAEAMWSLYFQYEAALDAQDEGHAA